MTNRLAAESSPYLLQHANNPVDWYAWGSDALHRAKTDDKPIFLSIGYAACHWCHVMEHESFENPAIAEYLNQHFICIKVDREERPDLDQIYMQAVMALRNGQGGWPLSAFLTPDQEVFFGGTYWPPTARHGMPGFDHVLTRVLKAFRERRAEITAHASAVTEHVRQSLAAAESPQPAREQLLIDAVRVLERHFDFQNGGFGSAPKFPHTMDLELLLRLHSRWPVQGPLSGGRLREMIELNLERMAHGGIFDHLGGGFARYSVDAQWLVPHFEKMLYDNALIASVYINAWRAWRSEFHALIARKTLDYLQRDVRDSAGGFHSSEDADSEGEEGKFYVWSQSEILEVLGKEGALFCELYGVTGPGNFEGQNILYLAHPMEQFAASKGVEAGSLRLMARTSRQKLFEVRNRRIRPGKDDKVIVSWNALAIEAFAKAATVFDSAEYLKIAQGCANFVWDNLRDANGRLLHVYRHGRVTQFAFLDDYSFLINALLTLYQADWDERWLESCQFLARQMIADFNDPDNGGFFYTAAHSPSLIARWKDHQESSIPSGSSMAAISLLRLGLICQNESWLELGRRTIERAIGLLERSPAAAAQMLMAVDMLLDKRFLIVLSSPTDDGQAKLVARKFQQRWSPNMEFFVQFDDRPVVNSAARAHENKRSQTGQLTAYVCDSFTCRAPIVGLATIESTLEKLLEGTRLKESAGA